MGRQAIRRVQRQANGSDMTDERKIEVLEFLIWDNANHNSTRFKILTSNEVAAMKELIDDLKAVKK